MKIKVNTLPVEDITLEFEDGVTKDIRICNYMFALIDQEFEDGCTKTLFSSIKKPYEYGSRLVYAGLKAADQSVTIEQAQMITSKLPMIVIQTLASKALELYSNADVEKADIEKKLKNLSKEEMQLVTQAAVKMMGL